MVRSQCGHLDKIFPRLKGDGYRDGGIVEFSRAATYRGKNEAELIVFSIPIPRV
jgi:hypothetical protein